MAIVRWKPFGDIMDWSDEVDKRMRKMFGDLSETGPALWAPGVDIKETTDALEVIAEIPGMKKEEISVSMHEGVLSISGEKKMEERKETESWHRNERIFGSFQRSFYIPSEIDQSKILASYKDGVLKVVLPKKEEQKRKEIPIKVN
ncbi:Hsp20/alpha crystallin family protein [bacterium]|nr:Hsp20/alpha crystallin family protein [bacterium]